jgi:hypothetical protein
MLLLCFEEALRMLRTGYVTILFALLLFSCELVAQHAGGQPHGSPASGGHTDNTDLTDFKNAMMLQANPYEVAQFKVATSNTALAVQQVRALSEETASAQDSESLTRRASALRNAIEDAQRSNAEFQKMFTAAQTTGLKKLTKELGKKEATVVKQQKVLEQELEHSNPDAKRIAAEASILDKALTAFQADQLKIGDEMGIENH